MSDLNELHDLQSKPETDRYNTWGIPDTLEVTKRQLEEKVAINQQKHHMTPTYSIRTATDQAFVGICGIIYAPMKYQKAEVWMKLNPEFWNQGYATEALNFLLDYCFDKLAKPLHRVEAGCAVENLASKKVLEKCGMVLEGIQRKNLPLKTGWSDNYEYAILREEWLLESKTINN